MIFYDENADTEPKGSPKTWYMLACFFHEVRGIESYCSYFNSKKFTCKGCPFLILESEAYKEMVKLAEKRAKMTKEDFLSEKLEKMRALG